VQVAEYNDLLWIAFHETQATVAFLSGSMGMSLKVCVFSPIFAFLWTLKWIVLEAAIKLAAEKRGESGKGKQQQTIFQPFELINSK